MAKCNVAGCNRTAGTGKGDADRQDAMDLGMCIPDLTEANWSNIHSDQSHDNPEVIGDESADALGYELSQCWICHPELDETRKAYVERTGTSRQGMTMVVPLRAGAAEKAKTVKGQLPTGFRVKLVVGVAGGLDATLTGSMGKGEFKQTFEAHWDHAGRWTSGKVNGRQVRNAKELLRVLGEPGWTVR